MGRMKSKESSPAPKSLVASAARIRGGANMGTLSRSITSDWHAEAWTHYDTIGEFRYACDWIGAQLSKAIIYATKEVDGKKVTITEGTVTEILSGLFSNEDGRAEMFRLIGIHMSVTGECWLVGYPDPDEFSDGGEKWEVAASSKVTAPKSDTEKWKVNDVVLDVPIDDVLTIRLWRPHPKDPHLSISPARAVLSTLRELFKLSQHVSAQVDSRLAGAGILLMPTTMSFPPPEQVEGEGPAPITASSAQDLMQLIMEAMSRSIQNRDDASALVPIVITASAEDIAAIKHLTFWSELDSHAIELRAEAIKRLALGMDMPPEVLQGAGDSNHWSAWQADESAIKSHTEPLLKIITTALGSHYLRPLLVDAEEGYDEENREFEGVPLYGYSVAADTSEMRLRPNRSKEALELYNLGELNGVALRRETGFDEDDAMNEEQLVQWLTRKVASGSTTPELVEAALKELGVTLSVVRPEAGAPGTEARPAPSLTDHPEQGIPDRAVSESRKAHRDAGDVPSADIARKASLIAAADQLVVRALERAGNRLKNKTGVKFSVNAVDLHTVVQAEPVHDLLVDAWAHVGPVAKRYGEEPLWLEMNLENYCSTIIRAQRPHTFEEFEAFMNKAFEPSAVAA